MVTSEQLATAAGITVPESVDLTTDFDAQVRYLFPVLRASESAISVSWPPSEGAGGEMFFACHIAEQPGAPGAPRVTASVWYAARATNVATHVAKTLGLYWGLIDADE